MAGIEGIAGLVRELPTILFLADVSFYVLGALFFGSIAVVGYRGYMGRFPHFGLRVLMGAISMIGGLGIMYFLPLPQGGFFQIMNQFIRLDILLGSLVSSVILAAGLFLVSFRLINVTALKSMIKKMEGKIKKAKKTDPKKLGWKDPVKIVGIAVIVGLIAFSLINFRGIPTLQETMSDTLSGITGFDFNQENLDKLAEQAGKLEELQKAPEGCASMWNLLQDVSWDIQQFSPADNPEIKGVIEASSGSVVVDLKKHTYQGVLHFIAVTADQQMCSATSAKFCNCADVSEFLS